MIKQLTLEHLDKVAQLHYKILHWSMSSRLGIDRINDLYKTVLSSGECFSLGYFDKNDNLVGFITCSKDFYKTRREILGNGMSFSTKIKLLLQNILHPFNVIDLFENAIIIPLKLKNLPTRSEILTFVTDTEKTFAHKIAAVKLFNEALKIFHESGDATIFAQVAKYDPAPNKFHKSFGSHLAYSYIRNNIYIIDTKRA